MISIVTPVYNVEKYLDRCIQSVLKQTYTNFELILVNDGSTDKSREVCEHWSKNDSRVKVIHQINSGVSAARNTALHVCTGEYITFLDSDDWLESNYLEELYKAMQLSKSDIVCCNYFSNGEKETVEYRYKSAQISQSEALDCYSVYYFTSVWGKLFSRDCLQNVLFKKEYYYSEDTLFYTQALLNSHRVVWLEEPLYHYYINPQGAISTFKIEKRITDFWARKYIADIYPEDRRLKSGAICRAVASAMSIDTKAVEQGIDAYTGQDELLRYVKENRKHYLINNNITMHNKLFCWLYSVRIFRRLYCRVKSKLRRV